MIQMLKHLSSFNLLRTGLSIVTIIRMIYTLIDLLDSSVQALSFYFKLYI